MDGGIFLIQENGSLVEMKEQSYDSEDLLQELLAKYPNLLAGDQIDSVKPRKWLLVSREMAVPDEEDGGGRWSLDHLFLDQDAIPTLVEVKRSNDTRIRREVVGQMLDYAANGVIYWPLESILLQFGNKCKENGEEPEEVLETFLDGNVDYDQFWENVKTNLRAGKIRLIFVADKIPGELQRIVEFLNEQMDPAEVLAIEIRQYSGQELKTLVPRVIGQAAKPPDPGKPIHWDEELFFDELKSRCGQAETEIALKIVNWARSKSLWIKWGKGRREGTFYPVLDHQGKSNRLFSVSTAGKLGVVFRDSPLGIEAFVAELHNRLNSIDGVFFPDTAINTWGSFPLAVLRKDSNLGQLFEIYEWVIEQVKSA